MDWNDLRLVLAIAEGGTLAGAARTLGHNHSTVFRRLNALESQLGTRLFERSAGRYQATPAGERMLELGAPVRAAFEAIGREISGQDLRPRGLVRVTTAPNLARTLLPEVVHRLQSTHPQILVELAVGDGEYDLNRREADIALRATTSPPPHLVGRRLMQLDWWACGQGQGAQSRPLTTLAGLPLIGADASLMRLPVFQWLEATHRDQIRARASDLSTMAALAVAGVGLALLPSDQDEPGLERQLALRDFRSELWLLTHPDLRRVARIRAVWDALVAGIANTEMP